MQIGTHKSGTWIYTADLSLLGVREVYLKTERLEEQEKRVSYGKGRKKLARLVHTIYQWADVLLVVFYLATNGK